MSGTVQPLLSVPFRVSLAQPLGVPYCTLSLYMGSIVYSFKLSLSSIQYRFRARNRRSDPVQSELYLLCRLSLSQKEYGSG